MSALEEVQAEMVRQDEKWGEQNHPDGTGALQHPLDMPNGLPIDLSDYADELADKAKAANDYYVKIGMLTWRDILIEEVFEAFAESDLSKLREELIQVAAVAVQWAGAIDRRGAQK